jgi:hypothetical protein
MSSPKQSITRTRLQNLVVFVIRNWLTPKRAIVRLVDKDGETWQLKINSGDLVQES